MFPQDSQDLGLELAERWQGGLSRFLLHSASTCNPKTTTRQACSGGADLAVDTRQAERYRM
jgi:hypothetical protein